MFLCRNTPRLLCYCWLRCILCKLCFIESHWTCVLFIVSRSSSCQSPQKKDKWSFKETGYASQCKAANIRNWFTVPAKFSRWWVNANGTEQSNFLQNTYRMQKRERKTRLKMHKRAGGAETETHWMTGEQKEPRCSNMFLPTVTLLVPVQL